MQQKTISLTSLLLFIGGLVAVQVIVLSLFGQPAICDCGYVKIWEGVVASPGNSQHLSDWYTPSHIIHGFLFFALFSWLLPRARLSTKLLFALTLEISWEIIENTPMVIDHYRKQALAQGYVGDSIINSLSDTVAMLFGFLAAVRLPVWASVGIVIVLEGTVMYFIRDGLFLNIVNLIYPLQFISDWQSAT